MSASLALDLASRLGVKLALRGGRIVATPKGVATQELRELAKAHKPGLIVLLTKRAELPPKPSCATQSSRASSSAIPLPTAAQQKATLECFAKDALAPSVREAAKEALERLNSTPRPPEARKGGGLTPDLKRALALTQEAFSQPPKLQPSDGLSPGAREALSVIRKLAGTARILDTLALADAIQVSVAALSGALTELDRKRLIHPGDWTRCGTKIKLVTH